MSATQLVPEITVGLDLGDRKSVICRLNSAGEVAEARTISTTPPQLVRYFSSLPPARVALEVGTHSPWVSRLLERLGHEVIVASPARIRGKKQRRKNDRIDAEHLARLRPHPFCPTTRRKGCPLGRTQVRRSRMPEVAKALPCNRFQYGPIRA